MAGGGGAAAAAAAAKEAAPAAPPAAARAGGGSALERAGLVSRLTFHWVDELIQTGWRRPLNEADASVLVPAADSAEAR